MKLIGCMAVRNEAWCLGLTLRAALQWCDEMVMLDHAPSDNSFEIALEIAGEDRGTVTIIGDGNPKWDEMRHRQTMLEAARERGATHIAIVDADELVTGNLISRATKPVWNPEDCGGPRDIIERKLPPGHCLQLPMYQLRGSLDRYHANGIWGNRWLSVAFVDDPRLSWNGDKFHSREPQGMTLKPYRPIQHGQGGVLHLWGLSERRLRAKHALYQCVEAVRWPDKSRDEIRKMYSLWRSPADVRESYPNNQSYREAWAYDAIPLEWLGPYSDWLQYLELSPGLEELWQEHEVRKMVAWHGAETFAGLDLFGLGEKY